MAKEEFKISHGLSSALMLIGMTIGAAFLSPAVTGNAIGNITNSTSTGIGVSVIILALMLGFFLSRR